MPVKRKQPAVKKRHIPKGKEGAGVELREAAKEGDVVGVEALGVAHSLDEVDVRGFTALMWGAWYGHGGVVEALVERGAGIDIQDEDGQTALFHASWNGHPQAVSILLKAGADPNKADNEGEPPLSAAARSGSYDCVRLLITSNADPTQRDNDGHNAVSRALKKGNTSIALLIEDYMKIYTRNAQGAALDTLLTMSLARHQTMQAQDQLFNPSQSVALTQVLEKGTYDHITVISGDVIKLVSRGKLPGVGCTVRINGAEPEWYVLGTVKGGGVKAKCTVPNATSQWGEAGDEVGAGLWVSVVPTRQAPMMHPQAGMVQPQAGLQAGVMGGFQSPPPQGMTAYQQYQYYQGKNQMPPSAVSAMPGPSKQHLQFGNAGAREASMPLAGVPSPGSPRRSIRSRYKKDNPAYRAPNSCTVCEKVKPPLSFCEDCNEEMCSGCWVREHQNRKRRLHIPHPVEEERPVSSDEED